MRSNKRVFALGFFDGVHLGHQALLRECCSLAKLLDCKAESITFDRHPQTLFLDKVPPLINTADDRISLLRSYGIGPITKFPVVKEIMTMPWQDFFRLLMDWGAVGFVCGHDFRFGHKGEGNAEKLRSACGAEGIPCVVVSEQLVDGIRVSSTHIRTLIQAGDMETAARFLGHPHFLSGEVVGGRHLGHKLGFPTANVLLPEGIVCPKHGVYACKVRVGENTYTTVTNVGSRPTVDGHQIRTESWLLDFDGNLYGQTIRLEFYKFLRPERKFESLDALKAAVMADGEKTREYFQ